MNEARNGEYLTWIPYAGENVKIYINSEYDNEFKLNIPVTKNVKFDVKKFDTWLSLQIDQFASQLLTIVNDKISSYNIQVLKLCLLDQKINKLTTCTSNENLLTRLQFLSQQITDTQNGVVINVGKLADSRFASRFENQIVNKKSDVKIIIGNTNPQLQIEDEKKLYHEKDLIHISHNNAKKLRNRLQECIMDNNKNNDDNFDSILSTATKEDIMYQDIDGNNAIHLAAYCGQVSYLNTIFEKFSDIDVNVKNNAKEYAITLAIKKRGYHKTMGILLSYGAIIPKRRIKALGKYAYNCGYQITSTYLSNLDITQNPDEIDDEMSVEYIIFMYEKAKKIDVQNYLRIACKKKMLSLVCTLLKTHDAIPTSEIFLEHCISKKPDDPDVQIYLNMLQLFLEKDPTLISQMDVISNETPLFKACERGNLPIVQFFLKLDKKQIDFTNHLGNTPLWISCAKRYPCIVSELLDQNASPNISNIKGNPPLYNICQKGPIKIAELLLCCNADVNWLNTNGDTCLLLAARNGQHEILKLFLNHIQPSLVKHDAHIDGFNALFAAVEQDRIECIEHLINYGMNVNSKTDESNPIIALATPLHLACFYGRLAAVNKLIEMKADINSVDKNHSTPLHTSVLKGNIMITKILVRNGADLHAQDISKNTPISFCRNKPEMYKLLVNPALNILMLLSKKGFNENEEKQAVEILLNESGIKYFAPSNEMLDIRDHDGSTPLMQAVIYSNVPIVSTFIFLQCDLNIKNSYGNDSLMFARWIKNQKILQICLKNDDDVKTIEYDRLQEASQLNASNRAILYLGMIPTKQVTNESSNNGFYERCFSYLNYVKKQTQQEPLLLTCDTFTIENFKTPQFVDFSQNSLLWNAKVLIVNLVASNSYYPLSVLEVFAITMFTNNPNIFKILNDAILNNNLSQFIIAQDFCSLFLSGCKKLPNYEGEVYIGSNTMIDRNLFQVGQKIQFPIFFSASTLFQIALEQNPSFQTNNKGSILLIKSKTGKFIAPFSQSSFDAEVVFLPNCKFFVTRWYRGNVICLGQENIREHTFGLKDSELPDYLHSNKALIIELQEI